MKHIFVQCTHRLLIQNLLDDNNDVELVTHVLNNEVPPIIHRPVLNFEPFVIHEKLFANGQWAEFVLAPPTHLCNRKNV